MAKRPVRPWTPPEAEPPPVRLLSSSGPTAAMRATWRDPEDLRPNARQARDITGHRSYCPLRWMLRRHKEQSRITAEHILAADLLRVAADLAAIGLGGTWTPGLPPPDGYAPRSAPTRAAQANLAALREFRRAMALYGARDRLLLTAVVLFNHAINRWTIQANEVWAMATSPQQEMTRLVTCLDRLVEHYTSEIEERITRGWTV